MSIRRPVLALGAALLGAAALAPAAQAKAYDTHIFRVAGVSLTGTLKYDVVPTGAGLTEHLTRTATLSGRPGGKFRIGPSGRNVAFFREAGVSKGTLTAASVATVFTQTGSYVLTRRDRQYDADDNPHDVITQESAGDCADRKTGARGLEATFRLRGGRLFPVVTVPDYPEFKGCQGTPDSPPSFVTSTNSIARARAYRARSLTIPVAYRKATSRKEDGATVSQVVTWKGTVTLTRVKTCVFRRGGNQFGCVRGNPDAL